MRYTLGKFKAYIESFPEESKFDFSISDPFSWRGSYDEVAFSIEKKPSTRTEILENIHKALDRSFYGYKGGNYTYDEFTPVNFEEDHSSYTDDGYASEFVEKHFSTECHSVQEKLVRLAFHK